MAAITAAAESARTKRSGNFLAAANRRASSTSNPASVPSGPGKYTTGPGRTSTTSSFASSGGSRGAGARTGTNSRSPAARARPTASNARRRDGRTIGCRAMAARGWSARDAADYSERPRMSCLLQCRHWPIIDGLRRLRNRSMAGRPALQRREPGQVRKEAATAIHCKCRGNGSPPHCFARHIDLMLCCSSAAAACVLTMYTARPHPPRASPETDLTANQRVPTRAAEHNNLGALIRNFVT